MDSGSHRNIDTLLGPISKFNGNIALLTVRANISVNMEVMVDVIDGLLKCFPGQNFFLLLDSLQRTPTDDQRTIVTSASVEALRYAAHHAEFNKYCVAQAILIDRLAISLIANFYTKTLKHNKNVKLVKTMAEAESWLKSKADLLELR